MTKGWRGRPATRWRSVVRMVALAAVVGGAVVAPGAGSAGAAGAGFESDDFNASTLNTSRWEVVDPRGDGTVATTGAGSGQAQLALTVPATVSHDAWTTNNALRVMQDVSDEDFSVEASFTSSPTARYQMQGLMAAQADGTFLRYSIHHTGTDLRLYAATVTPTGATKHVETVVAGGAAARLRMTRAGDQWALAYSSNGTSWTTAAVFSRALTISSLGVFAGNHSTSGAPPAYTALVDYAFDTTSPIVPEDGTTTPTSSTTTTTTSTTSTTSTSTTTTTQPPTGGGPAISLFYGTNQTFGSRGQPQTWANVLGNVKDPQGVSSLSYTLNGGASRRLSIGPDLRRLYNPGDFNAEIAYSELRSGANTVVIRAVDGGGAVSTSTVTVNKMSGSASLPYTANWTNGLVTQAQPVDGKWAVSNGKLRAIETGYDRTMALGALSWTNFEVTVPVTVHSLAPGYGTSQSGAPLLGLGLRWRGHTQVSNEQPNRFWYPTGAFAWHRWYDTTPRYELTGNDKSPVQRFSPPTLQFGATYMFKARAQNVSGGTQYSFKVWRQGSPEPAGWSAQIVEDNGPSSGGVLLIAHHVVADWGNVTVTAI
jgi:regulation of enolase protein 1 (concanavalin A-like superfamily)